MFLLCHFIKIKWEEGTREGRGILKIGYTEQEDEEIELTAISDIN